MVRNELSAPKYPRKSHFKKLFISGEVGSFFRPDIPRLLGQFLEFGQCMPVRPPNTWPTTHPDAGIGGLLRRSGGFACPAAGGVSRLLGLLRRSGGFACPVAGGVSRLLGFLRVCPVAGFPLPPTALDTARRHRKAGGEGERSWTSVTQVVKHVGK